MSSRPYNRIRNSFTAWKKSTKGKAIIASIYEKQKGICNICMKPTKFYERGDQLDDIRVYAEIDHIIAVSKGGTNDPKNFQILCMLCNIRKGNK